MSFWLAAVIRAGERASATVELSANLHARWVSLVGMLVTTNDAFYGANGVDISFFRNRVLDSIAYDAGTEENNELGHVRGWR